MSTTVPATLTEAERAEFWREHLRPAIAARQLKMLRRVIDKIVADGYVGSDALHQLAAHLDGAA